MTSHLLRHAGVGQHRLHLGDPDPALWTRPVPLRLWLRDQQHQHHPGVCWTCKWSGSSSDPLSPVLGKLHPGIHGLTSSPGDLMHTPVWEALGWTKVQEHLLIEGRAEQVCQPDCGKKRDVSGTSRGGLGGETRIQCMSQCVIQSSTCQRGRLCCHRTKDGHSVGKGRHRSLLPEAAFRFSSSGNSVHRPHAVSYGGLLSPWGWLACPSAEPPQRLTQKSLPLRTRAGLASVPLV